MKRQKFELTGDAAKVKRDRVQRRDLNDCLWHEADLRLAAPQGPITGALPTFGAECRVTVAFQTFRWHAAKVGS